MFQSDNLYFEIPNDFTVTEMIPAKLMTGYYYGNGHCPFFDNFITSPKLAVHMLHKNTDSCETIKPSRCTYYKEIASEEI